MNRKTTTVETLPTREQIEQQAAELAAQIDAYRQQDAREEQERQRRRAEAEREYDQQAVAIFSHAALTDDVARARAQFDAALADTPVVRALADYMTALQRRRALTYEYSSALNRLGLPDVPGHALPRAELGPVENLIAAAVQRLVAERIDEERAALAAQRETAITTATETEKTR